MANNLSFGVAVNLLTENFKRGQAQIQNGFREIKSTALQMAGVLGAGLGFEHIIKEMITVARESAAVNKALKVASGGWEEYGKNQKYIIETSEKFGLSINEMTGAFAKFTASAKTSNIPLKDQQTLFTGLNAALLATGASGDKKAEVFDAMSKMMQKGTIQLKPLIAGLGSALPESLSIMAKAMGVSVEKLRDMAKHGQLLASDVFPKFGAELEKAFGNVDTNTIGGALNRIGNSFEELTAKLNVGNIYKTIVNETSEVFKWIIEHFKLVGDTITNIAVTIIVGKAFGAIKKGYTSISTAATTSYVKQAVEAEKSAVVQELANSNLSKKSQKRYLDESLAAAKSYAEQEAAVNKFSLTSNFAFKTVGLAIKTAFMSFLPMILFSGAMAIYQHFSNLAEKAKELKAIWTDYRSGLKNAVETNSQSNEIKNSLKIVNDTNTSLKERQTALKTINSILGTNYQFDKNGLKINGDINAKIKERLDLLDKQSRYQYLLNKQNPNDDRIAETQSKIDVINNQLRKDLNSGKGVDSGLVKERAGYLDELTPLLKVRDDIAREKNKLKSELGKNTGETTETNLSGLGAGSGEDTEVQKQKLNNELANGVISQKKYNELFDKHVEDGKKNYGGILTKDEAKTNVIYGQIQAYKPLSSTDDKIETAKEDYLKKLTEQDGYLKDGIITQDEYTSAMSGIVDETLRTISAIKGVNFTTNDLVKIVKQKQADLAKKDFAFVLPQSNPIDHTFDYKKSDVEKQEDKNQQNDDFIKAIEKEFSDKGVKNIEKQIADAGGDLSKLKAQFHGQADDLIESLNKALLNAPDLSKALKLMQVKKDIKDLQKQLNSGIYEGVKNIAGSAKNMYEGFKALTDTLNNVDASGFEKFLAIWDALTNTLDGIMSVVKTIKDLTAVTTALTAAKQTQAGIEAGTAAAKIATNVAETASYTGLMAAETAAAYAFIPFVGEGLALAQIGVMQGAILASSIPKFVNGGIVQGGSISGDKILARVNAGEMILNQGQQSTLFALLNGQASGVNTQPQVIVLDAKVSGSDIFLSQRNYSNKKSKVK
jgi:tape measure domain-containing protein